ncbi:5' nucleotidase, NT5C type [Lacisediminihabitans sp. FW035]
MTKKVLYIDLDNTLVDFQSGIDALDPDVALEYQGHLDDAPGIFGKMQPLPGAIDAFTRLADLFDIYILSTAPWDNPSAWQHKIEWVREHLGSTAGSPGYKRLILSHHKHLNRGDYLVDDRPNNGASEFEGIWIQFGGEGDAHAASSGRVSDWPAVVAQLEAVAGVDAVNQHS